MANRPNLMSLPPEIRVMIFGHYLEWRDMTEELFTDGCGLELFGEMSQAIRQYRHRVVYVVPDAYWITPSVPIRDRKLVQHLNLHACQSIQNLKFPVDACRATAFAPHLALRTLERFFIRPSKIIVYNNMTRLPLQTDVDCLADAAMNVASLRSRITHIDICNVPPGQMLLLGNRLLNHVYVVNMDIQEMSDRMRDDMLSGHQQLEVNIVANSVFVTGQSTKIRITTLTS